MVTMMSVMKLMQLLMLQNVEVDYYHIKLCADYLKVLIVFFLCCSIPKTSYFCGVKQSRYGGVRKIFILCNKEDFIFAVISADEMFLTIVLLLLMEMPQMIGTLISVLKVVILS